MEILISSYVNKCAMKKALSKYHWNKYNSICPNRLKGTWYLLQRGLFNWYCGIVYKKKTKSVETSARLNKYALHMIDLEEDVQRHNETKSKYALYISLMLKSVE